MDISIIIIALNEEKYIPQLFESLENQRSRDFEIIFVDSNSTDKTREIAEFYGQRFREFTLIKLERAMGPGYARNRGAEQASYERLLFLDADTILPPDFIRTIRKKLLKKHSDLATFYMRTSESSRSLRIGTFSFNFFMTLLYPVYCSGYGACLLSTGTAHDLINGFREDLAICEDCNYIKRARRKYGFSFRILPIIFYTSGRRTMTEKKTTLIKKYLYSHLYRLFTGKEIKRGKIRYEYGNY
ncbi:MAG: glycosyltransferase [Bacteroidales bacterium]|nr:glycosyltransferase [Bacteroidales bacterium]